MKVIKIFDRTDSHKEPLVLWVGNSAVPCDIDHPGKHIIAPDPVAAELLVTIHKPDVVLSPMIAENFDCIDIAASLKRSEFRGVYQIIADDTTSTEIIQNEIREVAPDLEIRFDDRSRFRR